MQTKEHPRATEIVRAIQAEFAARTGLEPVRVAPRRYLWTDAFAVCNDLELHRRTGEREPLERALRLVEQVHETLGRHRGDDPRRGWISGLDEEQGRAHPTRGGLRIGKERNERGPDEAQDARLEWERDGQYYHYSTRWMHALARCARCGGHERHLVWALELAIATHAGFLRPARGPGPPQLAWKMSIDLSRPLVGAMGQHDPLDGLITFLELRAAARRVRTGIAPEVLDGPLSELRVLCSRGHWATTDPLGLGGLLTDAWRLAQLARAEALVEARLLPLLLAAAASGLGALARGGSLQGAADERLGFRELGLAIGLHAVERLAALVRAGELPAPRTDVASLVAHLEEYVPLAARIEEFWLAPEHRASRSWTEHLDIDEVMLATSLLPDGFSTI
jgi:hypothetical protein